MLAKRTFAGNVRSTSDTVMQWTAADKNGEKA